MINFVLERQAKSTDELLCRLIEERDGEKPVASTTNPSSTYTTIKGSAANHGMPRQATTSMYGQGYIHTTPSFTIPNPSSTPYTSGFNGQAYPNPNNNF
jgi:hypothetical protein